MEGEKNMGLFEKLLGRGRRKEEEAVIKELELAETESWSESGSDSEIGDLEKKWSGRGTEAVGDGKGGAEIFEDFDKEKEKVGEWWLQKGVEDAVEEEPGAEDEWGEESEAEKGEDKDDLIYSLREEDEEEEETDMALKTVMDDIGDVSAEELLESAEELLEFGRTALREMGGEMSEEG